MITLDLDAAEIGWLLMALRSQRTHDDKNVAKLAEKFGDDLDLSCGAVVRHRLGQDVAAKVKSAARKAKVQHPLLDDGAV